MSKYLPPTSDVIKDGILALTSIVIAAFIISRVPAIRKFILSNSLTVNDTQGNVLY